MLKEGVWTRPYADFDPTKAMPSALRETAGVEASLGRELSSRELIETFARLRGDEVTIEFDQTFTKPGDPAHNPEGIPIYYPIRQPLPQEIRVVGENQAVADGFGTINCLRDPKAAESFIKIGEREFSPYVLSLRTELEVFISLGLVFRIDEDVPFARYCFWKPNTNASQLGEISIPLALPSLKDLEIQLKRASLSFLNEHGPSFINADVLSV